MQWRKKLRGQEHLLQSLEKSNNYFQRVASMKSASDLCRVVHHGRTLVRNWSSTPSSSSVSTSPRLLPRTNIRRPRKRNAERVPNNKSNKPLGGNLSKGELCESTAECRKPTGDGVFTGDRGEGRGQRDQRRRRQCRENKNSTPFSSTASYVRALVHTKESSANTNAPLFGGPLGSSPVGNGGELPHDSTRNVQQISGSDDGRCLMQHPNTLKQQQTGWFWGGGDIYSNSHSTNDDKNDTHVAVVRKPGEGVLAAVWRKGGTNDPGILCASPETIKVSIGSRTAAETRSTTAGGQGAGKRSYDGNPALIGVASAKVANLSARNRAAELERLLSSFKSNRYSAPREECLAKTESMVRAAQIAISCANERLFELELQAGDHGAGGNNDTDQGAQFNRLSLDELFLGGG